IPIGHPEEAEEELKKRATILAEKCKEFAVVGHIHKINPGPVVTTFEFKPTPASSTAASLDWPTICVLHYKPNRFASIASPASQPSASKSRTTRAKRSACARSSSRRSFRTRHRS